MASSADAGRRVLQALSIAGLHALHAAVSRRLVRFKGLRIYLEDGVFSPVGTITTGLLAEALLEEVRPGERVLEVGTGSGALAILAASRGARVVATDVSERALRCAMMNAALNGVADKVEFRLGDLFEPVRGEKYDLIIFNPPYLDGIPQDSLGRAIMDPDGLVTRFLLEAGEHLHVGGRVLLAYSTIADLRKLAPLGRWRWRVIRARRLPWETVFVLRLTR